MYIHCILVCVGNKCRFSNEGLLHSFAVCVLHVCIVGAGLIVFRFHRCSIPYSISQYCSCMVEFVYLSISPFSLFLSPCRQEAIQHQAVEDLHRLFQLSPYSRRHR